MWRLTAKESPAIRQTTPSLTVTIATGISDWRAENTKTINCTLSREANAISGTSPATPSRQTVRRDYGLRLQARLLTEPNALWRKIVNKL